MPMWRVRCISMLDLMLTQFLFAAAPRLAEMIASNSVLLALAATVRADFYDALAPNKVSTCKGGCAPWAAQNATVDGSLSTSPRPKCFTIWIGFIAMSKAKRPG